MMEDGHLLILEHEQVGSLGILLGVIKVRVKWLMDLEAELHLASVVISNGRCLGKRFYKIIFEGDVNSSMI